VEVSANINARNSIVLLSLLLRGLVLIGKFLLIVVVAKFLSVEDVGKLGLVLASVGYALYFMGFDFYTFSTRELIGSDSKKQADFIFSQFRLYFIVYLFSLISVLLLFVLDLVSVKWLLLYFPLVVFEHLSQEFVRLYVVLGRPLFSGVILFVRSALWVYILALLYFWGAAGTELDTVFYFWLAFSATSVFLGFYFLGAVSWAGLFSKKLDFRWYSRGIKVALPLLIATVSVRGLFVLDRHLIEQGSGLAVLGVYTLYAGLCSAMVSFVDAGVIQLRYPKLVAEMKSKEYLSALNVIRLFFLEITFFVAIFAFVSYFFLESILGFLDNSVYVESFGLFWPVLAVFVVFVYSYIPHYCLYSMGEDRWIVSANVFSFLFFTLNLIFKESPSVEYIIGMMLASVSILLIIKSFGFVYLYRRLNV